VDTLSYIINKYGLAERVGKSPVEIEGVGRNDLARLFHELNFKVGVEIGVERGEYTEVLCRENPQAKIYAIDPWTAYRGYRDHVSQTKLDDFYASTLKRINGYNCELIKDFSENAVHRFGDRSLDFVYVDGNHCFYNTTIDIHLWYKKVRRGGILSGHDYRRTKNQAFQHVVDVVQGYTRAYRIEPWFVIRPGRSAPSWMWVV